LIAGLRVDLHGSSPPLNRSIQIGLTWSRSMAERENFGAISNDGRHFVTPE
jgi:hypothetical protein